MLHKKETGSQPSKQILSQRINTAGYNPIVYHKAMITVFIEDCNDFSQDFYDRAVSGIQLHMVECTCGRKGCLIRYGHYKRYVKFMSDMVLISVQRVRCTECGSTHALLPSLLVPYSQIPLKDQQEILDNAGRGRVPHSVMERNLLIDENNIKHIIRQFKKHWEQRLLSIGCSLLDPLTVPCLHAFSRQFMQIHRTRNKLFIPANMP